MSLDRDELFPLFGGFSDATLSDADLERLQTALRENAEARRMWFLFNDVEAGLASVRAPADVVPKRLHEAWWWVAAAAVAAAVVALLVLLPHRAPAPVAVLNAATNARWSDPNFELTLRGGELPVGPMRLEAGVAEFVFAGGATAVIEGPAVFEPVAKDRLVLQSGRAIGRCATAMAKLTIVTPNAAVTDLGTEFGVTVGDDQQTRVAVIKGAVELAAGKVPRRLIAGEAVAVDAHGQMVLAEFVIAEFSRMATILPPEDFAIETGANLLSDAGMKIPPGLTPTLPWHGSVGYVDLAVPGVARIRAKGNRLWPVLWQRVPAGDLADRVVVASVWAMQPSDTPLNGQQNAIVKMVFEDAAGREFAQAERHFLRAAAPRGQWIRGQVAAIAPRGTAAVCFQVLLNARGLEAGALLFKDASLVVGRKERP